MCYLCSPIPDKDKYRVVQKGDKFIVQQLFIDNIWRGISKLTSKEAAIDVAKGLMKSKETVVWTSETEQIYDDLPFDRWLEKIKNEYLNHPPVTVKLLDPVRKNYKGK